MALEEMTLKEYRDFGMVCNTEIKKQQEDIVVSKYISLFEGESPVFTSLDEFNVITSDYNTFITKCNMDNVMKHNDAVGGNIEEEYPMIQNNFINYYNSKNKANNNDNEEGLSMGGKQKILRPVGAPQTHYYEREGI